VKKILIYILFFSHLFSISSVFAVAPFIWSQIFHYDAQDINADGNTATGEPTNGSNIGLWEDSVNAFSWAQTVISQQPLYQTGAINWILPGVNFDGSDDILEIVDEREINLNETFSEKTLAVVIETGTDINSLQTIYEQGTHLKWYSFQISGWNLYGWIWNTVDWANWDEYKIINYGAISINESYYVTLVHNNTTVTWYLDGVLSGTALSADIQTIHGICKFDSYFGCSLYGTGGTIGIGGTQNDTLNLSDNSAIQLYQWNNFSGFIWELISWDRALTDTEINTVNTYFRDRWEPDNIAPTINSFSPNDNSLLPIWNFTAQFNYSDEVNGSGINTASWSITLQKWDWVSAYWANISSTYISWSSINSSVWSFTYNSIPFGKYRLNFSIADNAWNTTSQEIILYIDEVEMIVNTGSLDIWNVDSLDSYFSDELTVTVRTLWAAHDVTLKRNTDMSYQTESIPQISGTWYGYDQWPGYSNDVTDFWSSTVIGSNIANINTNGEKNTYVYRIKIWVLIDMQQAAGDYEWLIDIGIELDY